MATQQMPDEQWYAILYELNQAINEAQGAQAAAFLQWSRNPNGPIPPPAGVDDLQMALTRHMQLAPNDEVDDEFAARLTSERFAQEHVSSMGQQAPYALSIRHTQTRQYHNTLMKDGELLLDESQGAGRLMADVQTPREVLTEGEARARMAAALAAFQEADPGEDAVMIEDDRESQRTIDDDETIPDDDAMAIETDQESEGTLDQEENKEETAPAEPVEELDAHVLPNENITSQEDVDAAHILMQMRGSEQ